MDGFGGGGGVAEGWLVGAGGEAGREVGDGKAFEVVDGSRQLDGVDGRGGQDGGRGDGCKGAGAKYMCELFQYPQQHKKN